MLDPLEETALREAELFPRKEEVGVKALAAVANVARATMENFMIVCFFRR